MTQPAAPGTLYELFTGFPDHRKPRGEVYSLASLLTFVVTATLCGARSEYAAAQFGRDAAPPPRRPPRRGDRTGHGLRPVRPLKDPEG
jgi:hypothetical protein